MRYKIYSIGELPLLKIYSIGYSSDINETTFGPSKRNLFLIGYVLSGNGIYNKRELHAGQGFLVTPDIIEYIYPDKSNPWELLWFSSIDPRFGDLFRYCNFDLETNTFEHDSPFELDEIRKFVIANNRKTVSDAKMLELFFSVFKYHFSEPSPYSTKKTAAQRYIDFSVNYIKTHYNGDLSIAKLTELLGVSQPYLYKIYKEAFGKSPKAFISEYRITRANKLLAETDIPISEVASAVGYSDTFAFSKAFSVLQGVSPSKYRSIHKEAAST